MTKDISKLWALSRTDALAGSENNPISSRIASILLETPQFKCTIIHFGGKHWQAKNRRMTMVKKGLEFWLAPYRFLIGFLPFHRYLREWFLLHMQVGD